MWSSVARSARGVSLPTGDTVEPARDRHRQLEPSRTGAARVEIEHPVARLDRGLVRVADRSRPRTRRRQDRGRARRCRAAARAAAAPTSTTSVAGSFSAHACVSTLPRTANVGARMRSASSTSGRPTSPAWMMRSEPRSAAIASGRSRPCVSEMTPTTVSLPLLMVRCGCRLGQRQRRPNIDADRELLSVSLRSIQPTRFAVRHTR